VLPKKTKIKESSTDNDVDSTLLLLLLLIIPVVLTETNPVLSYTEFRSNVVNLVLFVIWAILSVKPTVFCGECNQM
jgi:hypothetical protein